MQHPAKGNGGARLGDEAIGWPQGLAVLLLQTFPHVTLERGPTARFSDGAAYAAAQSDLRIR
jgi:hypothetical protein